MPGGAKPSLDDSRSFAWHRVQLVGGLRDARRVLGVNLYQRRAFDKRCRSDGRIMRTPRASPTTARSTPRATGTASPEAIPTTPSAIITAAPKAPKPKPTIRERRATAGASRNKTKMAGNVTIATDSSGPIAHILARGSKDDSRRSVSTDRRVQPGGPGNASRRPSPCVTAVL